MEERVTHRVHVTFELEATLAGLRSFDTQRLVQSSTPDLVLQTKQIVELSLWNAMPGFVKFNIEFLLVI